MRPHFEIPYLSAYRKDYSWQMPEWMANVFMWLLVVMCGAFCWMPVKEWMV